MKYCTSCGAPLTPDLAFCTTCGHPVAATGEPAARAAEPAPAPAPAPPPWAGPAWDAEPDADRARWRGPALAVASFVLVAAVGVGSYLLIDALTGDEPTSPAAGGASRSGSAPASGSPSPTATSEASPSAPAETPAAPTTAPPPAPRPLVPVAVRADCVAPPALDSLSNTVTYEPERTTDAEPDTAWRCPGSAVGTRLVYEFDRPVTLTEVGLVPGYDKVDPADGIDRFTENRTVTGVMWHLDDGRAYRQDIPQPTRELTTVALPEPVTTTRVVLEILSTGNDGARRDYTPISEVQLAGY